MRSGGSYFSVSRETLLRKEYLQMIKVKKVSKREITSSSCKSCYLMVTGGDNKSYLIKVKLGSKLSCQSFILCNKCLNILKSKLKKFK